MVNISVHVKMCGTQFFKEVSVQAPTWISSLLAPAQIAFVSPLELFIFLVHFPLL